MKLNDTGHQNQNLIHLELFNRLPNIVRVPLINVLGQLTSCNKAILPLLGVSRGISNVTNKGPIKMILSDKRLKRLIYEW